MGLASDWKKQLKTLMESPFPEYTEPPVQNTLGGINQPSSIPVIDADGGADSCNIDCEALKELLTWAGADQSQADLIVSKAKILTKEFGCIKTDHINDLLAPAAQETEVSSPVIPVSSNGLESSRSRVYNENLQKVMNDEEIEVIKKKKEE